MLRNTIAIQRRVLGPDHPMCIATEKKLAYLCWDRRELRADGEAAAVLRDVLERECRLFGEDDPVCTSTREALGVLLQPSPDPLSEEEWSTDDETGSERSFSAAAFRDLDDA